MRRLWLRRRYIVDWNLQGSLCWHGLLHGALILLAISAGIFGPLLWNLSDRRAADVLEEQAIVMLYMHDRFWLLALLCAVIVVLGAIRFSHRIAGPLVRYKRNLRYLAEGKLPPPLRTRRGDYLKEEVACLNLAVAGVADRIAAIRVAHDALRRELDNVARSVSEPARQALRAADDELERRLRAFHAIDPGDERLPIPHPSVRHVTREASAEA